MKKNTNGLSRRVHFPEDEKRLPWLSALLDSYAIADTGIAIGIREEEKKRKKKLACGKGCGNCCEHQKDLPLYPHELVGIYWFVTEKAEAAVREILKGRFRQQDSAVSPCPFLINGSCSIHPVRPLGCRQFNVFTEPCASGEDPYYTRRDDVLVPPLDYMDRSFAAVLSLYQLDLRDVARSIKTVRAQIMNLRTFNWTKLAALLEQPLQNR